jgi:RNA polymerase sigma factor (sigma-70 family)
MPTSTLSPVLNQLRTAVLLRDAAGVTDGQLLESFITRRDQAAFAALVRRHGPMVLGVCQRVLGNHHDSEDAFQATFIVLVRKPVSIVPREMLANWLYGVAYRTALRARSMTAKRRLRERQVNQMPEIQTDEPDNRWHDLQPLLDQELARLPDKYRIPILLCDLEGRTGKDVARQLGVAEGTIASRLSRGRAMLAKRLSRYGLAVSAGSLAEVLTNSASASVPHALLSSTVKAASLLAAGQALTTGLISAKITSLAEGVLKAMLLSKLKTTFWLLAAIGVVATGAGGLSYQAIADSRPAAHSSQRQVAQVAVNQAVARQEQADADNPTQKKSDDRTPKEASQANQILDMFLKGLQAYDGSKTRPAKDGEQPRRDPQNLYREAFLRAFQISSELAKAKGKKATQESRSSDRDEQAQVLELTIKLYVKTQAVEHAKKEIESALSRVQTTTRDQRTELETLDEIERAVKDLKKRIQERKDGK